MRDTPIILDAHRPRTERRFPFRVYDPADRADVDAAVAAVLEQLDSMFLTLATKLMPAGADAEDAAQLARMRAWRSLEQYDASRGAAITTFVHQVASNAIRDEARKHRREAAKNMTHELNDADAIAPDYATDAAVEQLAEQIRIDPGQFLPPGQARVLQAMLDAEDNDDMADRLHISKVTAACYRSATRSAVASIAANFFDLASA